MYLRSVMRPAVCSVNFFLQCDFYPLIELEKKVLDIGGTDSCQTAIVAYWNRNVLRMLSSWKVSLCCLTMITWSDKLLIDMCLKYVAAVILSKAFADKANSRGSSIWTRFFSNSAKVLLTAFLSYCLYPLCVDFNHVSVWERKALTCTSG